jgi:hypothetical protein
MENRVYPAASDPNGKEVELEELVIDIPLALEPAQWPECCIYRIPKKLRKVNKEVYIPKLVSIGPFHHRQEELKNMEIQKLRYLREFCYRTRKKQERLASIIEDNEVKIRHCYSETFELSSKEFVNMVLLDGVFIIELFLRTRERENDYISSQPWLRTGIILDLILLENQLPFFVLEELYMFAFDYSSSSNHLEEDAPLVKLSRNFFDYYDRQKESIIGEEVKHFTDLLRYLLCPPDLHPTQHLDNIYFATKLDKAGLKFKPVEKRRLLDIKFPKNKCLKYSPCFDFSWLLACLPCLKCFPWLKSMQRVLEVPPFEVDDNTEALIRNLIAMEHCHYPSNAYICNYVLLLDYLIDTKRDVALLVDKKVIVNKLGSNATVATLINKLGQHIVEGKSCYYDLGRELNEHYDYPLNHIVASLASTYFHDFWRGTATVVGIIVLGFTFWGFLRPFVMKE